MKLYSLTFSLDESLLSIEDYQLNNFDLISYWAGNKDSLQNISSLKLTTDFKKYHTSDLVGNPLSLLLISSKAFDALNSLFSSENISHQIEILEQNGGNKESFYLFTPEMKSDCLDENKSSFLDSETIIQPVIKKSCAIAKSHIFRLKEFPEIVVVDEFFIDAVNKNNLSGFEFTAIEIS